MARDTKKRKGLLRGTSPGGEVVRSFLVLEKKAEARSELKVGSLTQDFFPVKNEPAESSLVVSGEVTPPEGTGSRGCGRNPARLE